MGDGTGQTEPERFFEQRFRECRCLRDSRRFDQGVGFPVGLADAEIAGYLVPQRRTLRAAIVGRRFLVGRGRGMATTCSGEINPPSIEIAAKPMSAARLLCRDIS